MNIRLINDAFYKPDFMEFLMRLPCLCAHKLTSPRWRLGSTALAFTRHRDDVNVSPR